MKALSEAFLLAVVLAYPLRAADYKVETIGALTDAAVSEAMRGELAPSGYRVTGGSGVLCEVWFGRVIPQKSAGADYSTLQTGTFAGVIRYPGRAGDYRGQGIRPGIYTLRYQTIPQDGNHLGVSPSADFLLLAPAADDKDPKAVIAYEDLVKLSKAAAGTNHPNPLYLAAPAGAAGTFKTDDEGHGILEVKLKAKPAGGGESDFPLAVVLVGKSAG
jgi:hypothetical protein